ncbi:alpha/beta fold hydrolase [Halorubrum vacuolatum]|uniref:Pimeloyl-ACP methyl ester carboxylesterase n=1 Tax=Halorubrum vacuolatum TaxID=63740 RepID=A0A238UNR3_HALVU|nr:alpha/beta fold hydrolase [Halorubrum vacuolatum]SNR23143.1 Pimeloyl-ACP methyl ester carboxylesterase [Halorubrum vacuolatum]
MPVADNNGVSIRYEVAHGTVGRDEAVVFCGDVGFGPWSFSWQHGALAGPYTVVTPESRGIGRSDTPPGPYTVETFAADLDAVLSDADVRGAHLIGYGLGGMVALAYAERFSRANTLTVIGSAATGETFAPEPFRTDPPTDRAVRGSTKRLLSSSFYTERQGVLDQIVEWRLAEDARGAAFVAQRDAVRRFDRSNHLFGITTPTLVIHGSEDAVCPIRAGEWLASGLPRGEFHPIDGAGHLVGVEASAAVNDAITGWIADQGTDPFA